MKTIKIKQIVISLFGLISTILISFMILGVLQKPKIQNIDFISLDTVENKLLNNSNQQVTSIENTDFSYTNLTGANFNGANLSGTDFTGAVLKNADFSGANCSNAQFSDSVLVNSQFVLSNLSNANFEPMCTK